MKQHPFLVSVYTGQKMKFSINDFFSKCDQIQRKLQICSHLPNKSLIENFIFLCIVIRFYNFNSCHEASVYFCCERKKL